MAIQTTHTMSIQLTRFLLMGTLRLEMVLIQSILMLGNRSLCVAPLVQLQSLLKSECALVQTLMDAQPQLGYQRM